MSCDKDLIITISFQVDFLMLCVMLMICDGNLFYFNFWQKSWSLGFAKSIKLIVKRKRKAWQNDNDSSIEDSDLNHFYLYINTNLNKNN